MYSIYRRIPTGRNPVRAAVEAHAVEAHAEEEEEEPLASSSISNASSSHKHLCTGYLSPVLLQRRLHGLSGAAAPTRCCSGSGIHTHSHSLTQSFRRSSLSAVIVD
eukprot:GHVU01220272.1.p2 GENE.GHVU01220272.1~~GHVU01220272.1.p2  ORF type:complete len:106 (-),score=15.63 GHVU01220272.1:126-443(-)